MKRVSLPAVMLGLALMMVHTVQALPQSLDARGWLDRMSHAFKEQNYQGVLIYGDDQQWQTLKITHGVVNGVEHERLLHLTGEAREVVRKGHDITCIHPGENVMRLESHPNPLSQGFVHQSGAIDSYYHLGLEPGERIAGRATQKVLLSPQDRYRYGYRLWLDEDSGLLLRSDLVDAQGRVLERFQFAEIDIGQAIPSAAFEPEISGHRVVPHTTAQESSQSKTQTPEWQLSWVPRGFMETASQVRRIGSADDVDGSLTTLMYTDGLAAITLFVDQADEKQIMSGLSQQWGPTSAVVRYLTTDTGKYRIAVVGEVPLMTAEKIAASVLPQ
ncbi:MAG: MucB/RseB C-terminal domain-containing protein [Saccharospirillaceae bacterium]|nr:MucB/RseB C-terminal domain-containing protein [Saccharospirillaceae bacterium]